MSPTFLSQVPAIYIVRHINAHMIFLLSFSFIHKLLIHL
jgi:hypothetical protein